MTELTAWLNSVDPSGNWTNNQSVLILMGGNPTTTYGDLKITHQISWVETTLKPNMTGVAKGTLVEVPIGTLNNLRVTIRDIRTCCEETINIGRCDAFSGTGNNAQMLSCVEDILQRKHKKC